MNIEFHMLGKSWLSYLIPTASFLYSSLCRYWDLPSFLTAEDFNCDVEPDGKIVIKGVTTTGEKIVCKNSQIFQMQTQNLCPPGHFSISFQLPGPVDHQQFSGSFGIDGILEGIVKKRWLKKSSIFGEQHVLI